MAPRTVHGGGTTDSWSPRRMTSLHRRAPWCAPQRQAQLVAASDLAPVGALRDVLSDIELACAWWLIQQNDQLADFSWDTFDSVVAPPLGGLDDRQATIRRLAKVRRLSTRRFFAQRGTDRSMVCWLPRVMMLISGVLVTASVLERVVAVATAPPRLLDRLVARIMLGVVNGRLQESDEFAFVLGDVHVRRRRPSLWSLNKQIAQATSAARLKTYAAAVSTLLTYFIGFDIIGRQLYALGPWWDRSHANGQADTVRVLLRGLYDAGPVAGVMVAVANISIITAVVLLGRWTFKSYREWFSAASNQLLPELRALINREVTRWSPTELLVERTPGLSGQDPEVAWIERASSRRIERLITELGATSVAVSGRRGVGKTTLLRRILDTVVMPAPYPSARNKPQMLPPLSVFLQAPVDYAPRDFLIDLFAQLCETVIAADVGRRFGPRSLPSRAVMRVVRFLGRLTSVVLGASIVLGLPNQPPPDAEWLVTAPQTVLRWVGLDPSSGGRIVFVMLLGLIGFYVLLGVISKPRSGPLARRASSELEQLRYLQTMQSERSVNLSRFGVGARRARQLAQQPLTMPELVRRYRDFAQQVAENPPHGRGLGLLVAIDELDRIANPASAEVFLNQIKATFGVPGCIYLVSVSEDALAQFERRISTLRTTVDTSFDEVVWLPDLSLQESMNLLRSRLTAFPDLFLALCYCLSGGVPRDLLRAARSLVDARRKSAANDLDAITRSVVQDEVQAFGRGALRSLALHGADLASTPPVAGATPDEAEAVEALLKLLLKESQAAATSLLDTSEFLAQQAGAAAAEYSAVLSYYATLEDLFLGRRELVSSAIAEHPNDDALALLEDLAAARSLLPVSPQLASERLAEIRQRTQN